MSRVMIIAGPPGSGKTTLASALARRSVRGVHLETDLFYRFLAHPLDPSTPTARAQNTVVVNAFLQAASAFSAGGYDVFVDGVIGPWWLDTVASVLPDYGYVLLHVELQIALDRTRLRSDQASASPEVVRTMHRQFDVLDTLAAWRIDTTDRSPAAVVAEFDRRHAEGAFRQVASGERRG